MKDQKPNQDQTLVEVKLDKPHTHAGKKHAAGTKIKVSEPERDWLAANQVIAATKEIAK